MITFTPPAILLPLLRRIDALAAHHGRHVYAVGGSVRDALLGRTFNDLDIAVQGDASAFARTLADSLGGHFVELDAEHGIARVVLIDAAVAYVDVASLHGGLDADLKTRDFTIDAMGAPLSGGLVADPCGGAADLAARSVRMTSERALDEDPLRMLRAVRIAAELQFAIEPSTAAAIRNRSHFLSSSAAERRRDELMRMLALPLAERPLRLLDTLGLLTVLLPELAAGRGITQPPNHHSYDVFEHGLQAVGAMDLMLLPAPPDGDRAGMWESFWAALAWCEPDLRSYLVEPLSEGRPRSASLKLAALLHDVAKPQTKSVDASGRIRFLGHAEEGARLATRVMRRLKFSVAEVAFVSLLVEEHLRPVQLAAIGQVPTVRALYRFHRDLSAAVPAVLLLALADAAASHGPRLTSEGWSRHVLYMNSLLVRLSETESIVRPLRLLSGHDIMSEFGIAEGPAVGQLLDELREAEAVGEVQTREQALDLVRARIPGLKGTQAAGG